MSDVLTFAEAHDAGTAVAGGKGWNLGRLSRFGFRIPPGCVLSVQAYWHFLKQNGLLEKVAALHTLSAEDAADAQGVRRLAALREQIEAGQLPESLLEKVFGVLHGEGIAPTDALAVRSSATAEDSESASFAGIHRSLLNVIGHSALATAIRRCYASIWTPTAVAYRRRMGLSDRQVGAALVIQKLVQSLYAGVAFSADPVTGRRDRVVVNASFGLGESVVAGSVEADEYHLHIDHAGPVKLVGGRIGLKHEAVRPDIDGGTITEELGYSERSEPVLAKPQLEELTRVVRRIQDTLGEGTQPQDVEWCHDGWSLIVTQARPITALPEATFQALAGQATIWSNANLKDAMPGVQSPLTWWFNSLTVEVLLRQIFWRGGYDFPEGLTWSSLHNGRAYMNLSALQWAAFDAFGWRPAETNRALGGHQPEIITPAPAPLWSRIGWQRLKRLTRMGLVLRKTTRRAEKDFAQIREWCVQYESQSFSDRYHELDFLRRLWAVEKQRREFLPVTMIHNVGALWGARLSSLLERRFPERGRELTSALLTGIEGITSADQGYDMIALARVALEEPAARSFFESESFDPATYRKRLKSTRTLQALDHFLQTYGHRGVYEMELMNPRWSEDPTFILQIIRSHLGAGLPEGDPRGAAAAKRKAAEAEVTAKLRFTLVYPLYLFMLGKAREAMRLREDAKSALVRLIRPARMAALAIGKRLTAHGVLSSPDDIFFLTGDEIASLVSSQWDGAGIETILAHRRSRRKELMEMPVPDVIMGERALVNLRTNREVTAFQRYKPGTPEPESGGHSTWLPDSGPDSDGPEFAGNGSLQGVAVSSGRAEGKARLIHHPDQGMALQKGEVLVAPSTDPAWTPLFLRASAVVMEVGGYLSHGAIVAREYGIPAIVNVAGAMELFKDGDILAVDGNTGRVSIRRTNAGSKAE